MQPARNHVEQVTVEVKKVFTEGHGWGGGKCADIIPTHARYSQGRGQKDNTTGDNVASGGQCTQGRDNIVGPTQGVDGRKSHAT